MAQIDGAGQQDTDNQNAEALQAALAQREVTLQGQPQGGSDVPSHENSDPVRRIGNSTLPSGSYRKTSCTVPTPSRHRETKTGACQILKGAEPARCDHLLQHGVFAILLGPALTAKRSDALR